MSLGRSFGYCKLNTNKLDAKRKSVCAGTDIHSCSVRESTIDPISNRSKYKFLGTMDAKSVRCRSSNQTTYLCAKFKGTEVQNSYSFW